MSFEGTRVELLPADLASWFPAVGASHMGVHLLGLHCLIAYHALVAALPNAHEILLVVLGDGLRFGRLLRAHILDSIIDSCSGFLRANTILTNRIEAQLFVLV